MPTCHPLGDAVPGQPAGSWRDYRAVATGETRPPKAGEWYLSGAIVAAYRAPSDFSHPYPIARIVRVRQVVTLVEV